MNFMFFAEKTLRLRNIAYKFFVLNTTYSLFFLDFMQKNKCYMHKIAWYIDTFVLISVKFVNYLLKSSVMYDKIILWILKIQQIILSHSENFFALTLTTKCAN